MEVDTRGVQIVQSASYSTHPARVSVPCYKGNKSPGKDSIWEVQTITWHIETSLGSSIIKPDTEMLGQKKLSNSMSGGKKYWKLLSPANYKQWPGYVWELSWQDLGNSRFIMLHLDIIKHIYARKLFMIIFTFFCTILSLWFDACCYYSKYNYAGNNLSI